MFFVDPMQTSRTQSTFSQMDSQIAEWRRQFSRPAAAGVCSSQHRQTDIQSSLSDSAVSKLVQDLADEKKNTAAVRCEMVHLRDELEKSSRALGSASGHISRLVATVDELKALVLSQQVELQDTKRRVDAVERLLVARNKFESPQNSASSSGVHLSVTELLTIVASREGSSDTNRGELLERVAMLEQQLRSLRSEHQVEMQSAVARAADGARATLQSEAAQDRQRLRSETVAPPTTMGFSLLRADDINLFDERDLCFDEVLDEINNFGTVRTTVSLPDATAAAEARPKREPGVAEVEGFELEAASDRIQKAEAQREAERQDRERRLEESEARKRRAAEKEQQWLLAAAEEKRRSDEAASRANDARLRQLEEEVAERRRQEAEAEQRLRDDELRRLRQEFELAEEQRRAQAAAHGEGDISQTAQRMDAQKKAAAAEQQLVASSLAAEASSASSTSSMDEREFHGPKPWETASQGGVDPSQLIDDSGLEPPPPIARELLPASGGSLQLQVHGSSDSSDSSPAFTLRPLAKKAARGEVRTSRPLAALMPRHDNDEFDF
jgi:hypothetical protein